MHRNRAILLLAAGLLATGGCATVKSHWPFGKAMAAAPEPVQELRVEAADAGSMPVLQYWQRNTLVIDLTTVPAAGQVQLVRDPARAWPAQVAFRMTPGRFEALEVRGAQRVVLPVAAGTGAVTALLPPGTYDSSTARLAVRWGSRAGF
ncbi:MAG TPA: hypothetical protein VKO83_04895 [Steroidobacteraceae bacterium]|nr:hypothetical protein [Steroidobacteraceae bacterium]